MVIHEEFIMKIIYARNRIFVLVLSVLLIIGVVYLNNMTFASSSSLLGVKVCSNSDINNSLVGRIEIKDVYHFPIQYDGHLLPYDWQTNTLYIPQSINNKSFSGKLSTERGELYFLDTVFITDYPEVYSDESEEYYSNVLEGIENELEINTLDISNTDKKNSISKNAVYTLYYLWDNCFTSYNVIFTGLPTVSLTYNSYDEETMSWDGNMMLMDPYHNENGFIENDCMYRLRGDSTTFADKKSYTLKLHDKKSLAGLRNDDDWVLTAGIGDNGYVHNKLAYDLWNDISATNHTYVDETMRGEYVEVFYDNTYKGVYLLCERIDKKMCNLKDDDYMFRVNEVRRGNEYPETPDSTLNTHVYYQVKWPKEYTDSDYDLIRRFERAFYSIDEFNYEYAKSLLNMDNVKDINLYSMLLCTIDNWTKNAIYIATKRDDYRFSEIMWDMNETCGTTDTRYLYDESYISRDDMMIPYVKRLYDANPQEISGILYNRWKELRKDVVKKKRLTGKVDKLKEYLTESGALTREIDRWPEYINLSWRYDNIYAFLEGRIDYLDEYLEKEYLMYNE